MLSGPVPSERSEPGSTSALIADGCAEEPEPPSSRVLPARSSRINPSAAIALLSPGLVGNVPTFAATTFAPSLQAPEVAATGIALNDALMIAITPLYALFALLAVVIGTLGAIAAASLIGYSPTLLGQLLDDRRRPDAERLRQELSKRDREYFIVGIIYAGAGWVFGMLALRDAVDAQTYPWALALWIAMMLFGAGSLPGAIADARSERAVLAVLPLLRAGHLILRWPLVLPLFGITRLTMHALRLQRIETDDPADVQNKVMAAVADHVDQDELADAERTWIGNILALKDQQVSTVMTPRPDIIALNETLTLREAVDQALEHEFSRYPVYRERIDEVIGIFYVKDALRMMQQSPEKMSETSLSTLLRDPLFVPETTSAAQLLSRVQAGNQHMAIVIDEYGTTVGIATVEDLVEEIVGEIEDEYDPQPSDQNVDQIVVVEAGRIVEIPGRTSVQDINKLLGSQLSDDGDWETVAGLVIDSCNRIPAVDETVVVGDVEFRVLEADERRVQRLRVTSIAAQPAEGTR
jgi:putative hemolysin